METYIYRIAPKTLQKTLWRDKPSVDVQSGILCTLFFPDKINDSSIDSSLSQESQVTSIPSAKLSHDNPSNTVLTDAKSSIRLVLSDPFDQFSALIFLESGCIYKIKLNTKVLKLIGTIDAFKAICFTGIPNTLAYATEVNLYLVDISHEYLVQKIMAIHIENNIFKILSNGIPKEDPRFLLVSDDELILYNLKNNTWISVKPCEDSSKYEGNATDSNKQLLTNEMHSFVQCRIQDAAWYDNEIATLDSFFVVIIWIIEPFQRRQRICLGSFEPFRVYFRDEHLIFQANKVKNLLLFFSMKSQTIAVMNFPDECDSTEFSSIIPIESGLVLGLSSTNELLLLNASHGKILGAINLMRKTPGESLSQESHCRVFSKSSPSYDQSLLSANRLNFCLVRMNHTNIVHVIHLPSYLKICLDQSSNKKKNFSASSLLFSDCERSVSKGLDVFQGNKKIDPKSPNLLLEDDFQHIPMNYNAIVREAHHETLRALSGNQPIFIYRPLLIIPRNFFKAWISEKFLLRPIKGKSVVNREKSNATSEVSNNRSLSLILQEEMNSEQQSYYFFILREILKHYGAYPPDYRHVIWRFLLMTPSSFTKISSMPTDGPCQLNYSNIVENLLKPFAIKSSKSRKELEKAIYYIIPYFDSSRNLAFIPRLIFPFLKSCNDDFSLVIAICASVAVNWLREVGVEDSLSSNLIILVSDMLLQFCPNLYEYFYRMNISIDDWFIYPLSGFFSDIISGTLWLQLIDHAFSNSPVWLFCFYIALLQQLQDTILDMELSSEIKNFLLSPVKCPFKKVLSKAYTIHKSIYSNDSAKPYEFFYIPQYISP